MSNSPTLRSYAYVLAVPDLARTADYFHNVLGFTREWQDGDNWQALARDGVRVMLGHCPDALPPRDLGDHSYFAYLHVDDIDALHTELLGRGALIRQSPTDKPWGMREMALETPDGHRLMVGQEIR
ncbi:MAG: bleomycin resistance family protein [Rhodocyclaceae bacterium]